MGSLNNYGTRQPNNRLQSQPPSKKNTKHTQTPNRGVDTTAAALFSRAPQAPLVACHCSAQVLQTTVSPTSPRRVPRATAASNPSGAATATTANDSKTYKTTNALGVISPQHPCSHAKQQPTGHTPSGGFLTSRQRSSPLRPCSLAWCTV